MGMNILKCVILIELMNVTPLTKEHLFRKKKNAHMEVTLDYSLKLLKF